MAVPSVRIPRLSLRPALPGRHWFAVALALLSIVLQACSTSPHSTRLVSELPPLQLQDRVIPVDEVVRQAPTPDLLAIDDDMREFVRLYTRDMSNDHQRLLMLHRAVTGAGSLNLQYQPFAEGTASEVFHRGSANCLSYANLMVALAREAGLDARYQWLEVRPQWTRMGERVMVRLHVNVVVKLRRGHQYMVDIDPLPTRDIAGSREISDGDARALYHNNIAMDALANEDLAQAWLHGVRALQLSPQEPHLWVNLGAIYRYAGQLDAAEANYLYALELDPWERSAMNNLTVLYGMQGRDEEREHWLSRVAHYRNANPYFHAWLGDQAADSGNWHEALQHYDEALDLLPSDSSLLYATGLIHYQLNDLQEASGYIQRAIDNATLSSELETYRAQLKTLRQQQVGS